MLPAMPTALWLLPRSDDESFLATLIEALATDTGTRPFQPHLTVCGGLPPSKDAWERFDTLSNGIDLAVMGLEHSAAFSMALYLRCADAPHLAGLRARIEEGLGLPQRTAPPHVSLLYGEFTAERRVTLARRLAGRIPTQLHFDRIATVEAGDWRDVTTWRLLRVQHLDG
jgi:hypothetical protein